MEQKPPEPVTKTSPTELLKQHRENPLFWFLKNIPDSELTKLQYKRYREQTQLSDQITLEAEIETLGSNIKEKLNEDDVLILPLGEGRVLYAVIDGVSAKIPLPGLPEGISGGFYISHLISLGFPKSETYQNLLRQNPSPKDIVIAINRWIKNEFERLNIEGLDYSSRESIPGVSITLAVINAKSEKTRLGDIADTMAIGKTKDGRFKMLTNDQNAIFDQKVMDKIVRISNETGLTIKAVIDSSEYTPTIKRLLLNASKEKINTRGGCGVLNGQEELITNNLIEESEYDINDYDEIWLVSDGAILAFPEVISLLLASSEGVSEKDIYEALNKVRTENKIGPLESLIVEGAIILNQDPQRTRVPRFKDRDDATIIRIKIKHA